MRLRVINYEFPPLGGGAGNATACLCREWAIAGHAVEVITGGFQGLPALEHRDGFIVRRLPTPRRHQGQCSVGEMLTFILASSIAAISGPKPDLAIAFFSIPSGPAAWLLRLLRGVPYVVSLRGGDVPGFDAHNMALLHALTNPLTALLWNGAAAVVGNSTGLCALARDFAPGTVIPEIPNGVDTGRFTPGVPHESAKPSLLFVGRLARQKGVADLLEAMAMIPLPCTLRIVGDGPERPSLQALAIKLGLAERVTFHGWAQRETLPSLYQAADVFVFPSHDEGMPNAVLEALASGLPIVATAIAGNDQLVINELNGKLVPVRNPHAFAAALAPLLLNKEHRQRMGCESRRLALERFSWAIPAQMYLHLFGSILERNS